MPLLAAILSVHQPHTKYAAPLYMPDHPVPPMTPFDAWTASRNSPKHAHPLPPGAQRPFTLFNVSLAAKIVHACFYQLVALLWSLNPVRTAVLIFLTLVRGLLPAFRGFSQARVLDEVRHHATPRLRRSHLRL